MTTPFLISYIALWVIVAVQFVASFALYHHFGQMYLNSREGRATQGPSVASNLKPLVVHDVGGTPLSLPLPKTSLLMMFVSTSCPLCDKLRPELGRFAESHTDLETLVICAGDRDAVRRWATGLTATRVVADPGYQIATHFEVGLVPFCIGVDYNGTVRTKGIVNDRAVLDMAAQETLLAGQPHTSVATGWMPLPVLPNDGQRVGSGIK